ncbi:MAG: UdgX family uracil-DNA binding protein [Mycobacteriales bacterium]
MPAQPEHPTAAPFVPDAADLAELASAAAGCRGCHLYANATQTVFGDGSAGARIALVGEQPGDVEDRRGLPFVGPAGMLLDRALDEAGIDRRTAYVTNAVKHFKFTMAGGGKRRIHAKPDTLEVAACRPWLTAELSVLDPEIVVCLGATAAQSLLGPSFRVTRSRGVLMPWPPGGEEPPTLFADVEDGGRKSAFVLATIHPSAVLRADDRETAYAGLVSDLRVVAQALAA